MRILQIMLLLAFIYPAAAFGQVPPRAPEPQFYLGGIQVNEASHAGWFAALPSPFLRGILYWKLSSHEYHEKVESFMVKIGGPSSDPMLPELRRFLP